MNRLASRIAIATFASLSLASGVASAGTRADCGNIELTAIGECHFEFEGGCKAQCEPVRFQAACDGQCNAEVSVDCNVGCQASCEADCQVQPASFACNASCRADCEANVQVLCEPDDQECITYCQADCNANCDASCSAVPPQADCQAQCQGSCAGSCETEANFDCSVSCSADIRGGCEVDCDEPAGALFCDGQYIAVQDLPGCAAYLLDNFQVELEFEASASATCAAAPGEHVGWAALLPLGLAAGATVARRRRRRI
jgi:hypothetical protein